MSSSTVRAAARCGRTELAPYPCKAGVRGVAARSGDGSREERGVARTDVPYLPGPRSEDAPERMPGSNAFARLQRRTRAGGLLTSLQGRRAAGSGSTASGGRRLRVVQWQLGWHDTGQASLSVCASDATIAGSNARVTAACASSTSRRRRRRRRTIGRSRSPVPAWSSASHAQAWSSARIARSASWSAPPVPSALPNALWALPNARWALPSALSALPTAPHAQRALPTASCTRGIGCACSAAASACAPSRCSAAAPSAGAAGRRCPRAAGAARPCRPCLHRWQYALRARRGAKGNGGKEKEMRRRGRASEVLTGGRKKEGAGRACAD